MEELHRRSYPASSRILYPVIPPACALGWTAVSKSLEEVTRGSLGINGVCTSGVTVGFLPSWWNKNGGVEFGESWHRNPEVRQKGVRKMQSVLYERFGDLGLGCAKPQDLPGTIDFLYGLAFIPSLFGADIRYSPDGFPKPTREPMAEEEIETLEVPDVENAPLWRELVSQIDYLESHYGGCVGRINLQGVLNLAFQLRGQQIFVDLLVNFGLCDRLFRVLRETQAEIMRLLHKRLAGDDPFFFVPSNCVVNMVSGEVYRELLLPHDRELSTTFEMFGIHNCGWCVDPYVQHYVTIDKVCYLDMGMESDLEEVRRQFPDAMLSVIYPPEKLRTLARSDLRSDISSILGRLGPRANIIIADIEVGTDDDVIRSVHEAALDAAG